MKLITLCLVVVALSVSGCATIKIPQSTGGSKADGYVEMSYEYGMFESPKPQWGQAAVTAGQRCAAWGYKGAVPFGGKTKKCQIYDLTFGSCSRYLVTAKYQCID